MVKQAKQARVKTSVRAIRVDVNPLQALATQIMPNAEVAVAVYVIAGGNTVAATVDIASRGDRRGVDQELGAALAPFMLDIRAAVAKVLGIEPSIEYEVLSDPVTFVADSGPGGPTISAAQPGNA